tara:strand:+ start:935 stop:1060 length:126 start_codon:yes stop_codon:yes gene_type:complete
LKKVLLKLGFNPVSLILDSQETPREFRADRQGVWRDLSGSL